mmetsp:Transcript_19656/g.25111  ORF Transcript_19656/g.25111 Transcript_19656/m.25111 type:complete len:92 (-) Transcript_19656:7-282(-)
MVLQRFAVRLGRTALASQRQNLGKLKNGIRSLSVSPNARPAAGVQSETIFGDVKEYYGKVLSTTKDLKTSACTTSGAPATVIQEALKKNTR